MFVKDDIQIGDQLESDHYLITIEEVLSSRVERTNDNADQVSTLPGKNTNLSMQSLHMQGRSNLKPTVAGNCLRQNRVGLKRQKNVSMQISLTFQKLTLQYFTFMKDRNYFPCYSKYKTKKKLQLIYLGKISEYSQFYKINLSSFRLL